MENLKHTKGEWFANNCMVTINGTFNEIAKCHSLSNNNCLSLEEMRANAKLIAAAPDLLEALIEALPAVMELNGEYQEGWDETIIKIENAINKATK